MKYLLLFNLFLSQFCFGQKCLNDSLFNRFKNDIQIELARHGQVEWDDETRESYYTLMLNCPIEDLVKYVDDSIPAIRCLIFAGLAQNNIDTNLLSKILSKFINDTALYVDSPTDVVVSWSVSDYMQTALKLKKEGRLPNPDLDYASILANLKKRPRLLIPGEYHGIVPKDSLLKIDRLTYSKKGYRIVSFTMLNGDEEVTSNNIFTDRIKELIRNTKSGERLFIDGIIAENADKLRRKLPSIVLELR